MSKYFTIDELCSSPTAKRLCINNAPNIEQTEALSALANEVLDKVRELAGEAVHVNSGFRCDALNVAVKGATNSQHCNGEAADISLYDRAKNKALIQKVLNSNIDYDQLIDEYDGQWIHISYKRQGGNRRQFLKIG